LKTLPAIQARITSIWGSRDAFTGPHLEECRRILASGQRDPDFRVIEGAGHWTPYEAADQVNAILIDMLR
jgi:pimeloyl-ACP methyl ester carboxylesterase